VGSIGP
jgi:mRNA interferase HigB